RVGIGQELKRGCIGIFGSAELDGIKGAVSGNALGVGNCLEGPDVGVGGENRIVLADDTIEQVDARHYKAPPGDAFPRRLDVLCRGLDLRRLRAQHGGIARQIIDYLRRVYRPVGSSCHTVSSRQPRLLNSASLSGASATAKNSSSCGGATLVPA